MKETQQQKKIKALEAKIQKQANTLVSMKRELEILKCPSRALTKEDFFLKEDRCSIDLMSKDGYFVLGINKENGALRRYDKASNSDLPLKYDERGRIALHEER